MPRGINRYAVAMVWQAISAPGAVTGQLRVPGSKSLSNRALLLAALSDGPSQISGVLLARDTKLMIAALQVLGTKIELGEVVQVTPGKLTGGGKIDVGLAGTVMRFVPAIAALADGETYFYGDEQASLRPMQVTIDSLRQLGINVKDDGKNTLPFTVCGAGGVAGGKVRIDVSGSSQFLSALLLVGARFNSGVTVVNTANTVPSLPHIEMTIANLAEHGVVVERGENTWKVLPGPIKAINRIIEPDLSNATVFLAAAMLTGGDVTILDWPKSSSQPSDEILNAFEQLGGKVEWTEIGLRLTGPAEISPIQIDLSAVGEITPTISAIAAAAPGISVLTGIGHLRGHETDRLKALVTELAKVGIFAKELPDGLEIHGGTLTAATSQLHSYHDHRMATFAAILGLKVPLELDDIATTAKTIPDFANLWQHFIAGAA